MDLNYRTIATDNPGCPLILMHGLFGSASNLQIVARRLSEDMPVVLPDLRNHGRSPHDADVSYATMGQDILRLMDKLQCQQSNLLGHSMGGKVAMWLALNYPDRINHLIIADISPVRYPNRFGVIFNAMQTLQLETLASRKQADEHLAEQGIASTIRSYLLQNLVHQNGVWRWRINLQGLFDGISTILDFPKTSAEFAKPVLFLRGEKSDYVAPEYEAAVYQYFPMAEISVIEGVGHWLYAEKPEEFSSQVKAFLPNH